MSLSLSPFKRSFVVGATALGLLAGSSSAAHAEAGRAFPGANGRISATIDYFGAMAGFYQPPGQPVNTLTPGRHQEPSPDGKKVAFGVDGANTGTYKSTVGVLDVATTKYYPISKTTNASFYDVHWSPDGKKLLYAYRVGNVSTIAYRDVTNLAAPRPEVIITTQSGNLVAQASWSHDGAKVVYTRQLVDAAGKYSAEVRLYALKDVITGVPSEEVIASEPSGLVGRVQYWGKKGLVAVDDTNRLVYTLLNQTGTVAQINLLDYRFTGFGWSWIKTTISTTATMPSISASAMWAPSGEKVVWVAKIASGGNKLVVATRNSSSGNFIPGFVSGSGDAESVAFSPDSSKLVYTSPVRKNIRWISAAGGASTVHYNGTGYDVAWGKSF